jgi:hypothetical protein
MPPHDIALRNAARHGGQPGTGALPGPLRRFADRLDEVRSAEVFDVDQAGRILVELAADEEFFGPLIAQLPQGTPGSRWLIRPEREPRLVPITPSGRGDGLHLLAPVLGRHRPGPRGGDPPAVPPRDVHNHGHVAGSGPSPYSLILLGDDMLLSDREEYDPERGTWRALAPGDPGRDNR